MNPFQGKVSIVTGGGAGIGQTLCEELSRRGSRVIIVDVDERGVEHVAGLITQQGGQARTFLIDVKMKRM